MEAHMRELKSFVNQDVLIRFLCGKTQEKSKRAHIRKLSVSNLIMEGLSSPNGRTYRIPIKKILKIESLENNGKIWRKREDDRV